MLYQQGYSISTIGTKLPNEKARNTAVDNAQIYDLTCRKRIGEFFSVSKSDVFLTKNNTYFNKIVETILNKHELWQK
jgi:hypothetical protein